jgi:hypothetical protein
MRRLLAFILLTAFALVLPAPPTAGAAVQPEITLTMTQGEPASHIATPLVLTAEVKVTIGGKPLEWGVWYVEFTGASGWSSGAIVTHDGVARYSLPASTVTTAQTETIRASLVSDGCAGISDDVEHTWFTADALAVTLQIGNTPLIQNLNSNPPRYEMPINVDLDLRAALTRKRAAIGGVALGFTRTGDPAFTRTTNSNGIASETWRRTTPVLETVTVTEPTAGNPQKQTIEVDWYEPQINGQPEPTAAAAKPPTPAKDAAKPRSKLRAAAVGPPPPVAVVLHPSADEDPQARVGEDVVWSAEVVVVTPGENPDLPIEGIEVTFTESGGRWSQTAETDEYGVATLDPTTSDAVLTENVTASVVFDGCSTVISEPVAFEWWEPVLTLAPLDATSVAGEQFGLTATLTQSNGGAIPFTQLALTSHSTQCNLPDEFASGSTGENGVALLSVTRAVPTTDLITVVEGPEDNGGALRAAAALATASTTHTWTSDLGLELDQDLPNTRVGDDVTLTARVNWIPSAASPGPAQGVSVTFSGFDGDDVTRTTNFEGVATYSYTKNVPGTDHIIASTEYGCDTISDSVDHTWWVPALTLTPRDTTTPAGEDVEFTGWLRHDPNDEALLEKELTFTLHSTSCNLRDLTETARTGGDGVARVIFNRPVPSTDTVTVFESGPGLVSPQTDQTTHTWGTPDPPPFRVAVEQSSTKSRIGQRIALIARVTVTDGEAPRPQTVRFVINGQTTDPINIVKGVATHSYTRTTVGTDTIAATTPYGCGVVRSDELDHRWFRPEMFIASANATSTVGESVRITASLSEGGRPLGNRRVRLTIRGEASAQSDRLATERTNSQGQVSVLVRRGSAGVFVITARELAQPNPASATTRHTWVAEPVTKQLTLVATPAGGETEVGKTHTINADTAFGGQQQKGVQVTFIADKADEDQQAGRDVSGKQGLTSFSYTRDKPGTDEITVTATFQNQTVSQTVSQEWTKKDESAEANLTLGPDNTSSAVGKNFIATAEVTQDGHPVPGVMVSFTSSMAGSLTSSPADETDADGLASVTTSPAESGDELITAEAVVDGQALRAKIIHTWTDDGTTPPPEPTPAPPPTVPPRTRTAQPGGELERSGSGCKPGETVVVYISGDEAGRTTADDDGSYRLRVPVPNLPLGQYVVRTTCGSLTTTETVDLNLPQSNGSATAAGATTGGVLLFFVLLANALMRGLRGRFD